MEASFSFLSHNSDLFLAILRKRQNCEKKVNSLILNFFNIKKKDMTETKNPHNSEKKVRTARCKLGKENVNI